MMGTEPSGTQRFKVICSVRAAAELSQAECADIIRGVISQALERDRGIHEGLVFSFDMHGKEWQIVVDLVEGWVKILGKDELAEGIKEAVRVN
jgi:hypothetical protein